jgi:subtilisin family serine protease
VKVPGRAGSRRAGIRFRRTSLLVAVAAGCTVLSALAAGAAAGGTAAGPFTATPLQPAETIEGVKSQTSRLAQTDPSLLGRTDATPVSVVVKYDYDSTATYEGGVQGLAATSPKVTGKKLKANRGAVAAYEAYAARVESQITSAVQSAVPSAQIGQSFRDVYGGVAMVVPANRVGDLLAVDGVVAVQQDALAQPLTDASPQFIGATSAWSGLGGGTKAGEGVIVGVIDTGIWPEHPSFADRGIDHPGGTYGCEFGSGLDPALGAPFACNDKLIGAYAKTTTYMTVIGALAGEFCNNVTRQCSARDSEGHGTHTASTAAGSPVDHAVLLGVDRGAISGIAPGAHVIMYRVCMVQGCFGSDSVSAVNQAILDGADVINFSISGGASAYTDPVELAFLDAYAAGIIVNASAGNNGPGAATANHAGPWTNTVGASTSNRHFFSTLNLTATGGDTLSIPGVTVTAGIAATDVVLSSAPPYSNPLCQAPAAPGTFTGKIVVCDRGVNARVDKGYNVLQGGAAGMILTNVTLAASGLNSDNHWLPAIHTEYTGRTALRDFVTGHTGVKASWASGTATPVRGDVMASFSSRGPLGDFLKPDVTSVGVQVLAGHTPEPIGITNGPPGQLFQAIAGTSMSSPHAAGTSALVKAAHPDWTPGQIKSALMTSSVQDVLKEDGATPAIPFDMGAGSIRADRAINPTVTFDVTAAQYVASATDPLGRVNLNLPSIYSPSLSGILTTTRTLKNVSGIDQAIKTSAVAPPGTTISVSPKTIDIAAGATATMTITIDATNAARNEFLFGQIRLVPNKKGQNGAVLPVAFRRTTAALTLTHGCDTTAIKIGESAKCTVEAQNLGTLPADASLRVTGPTNGQLTIRNVSAPGTPQGNGFAWSGTLTPALAPPIQALQVPGGSPAGYLPLSLFPSIPVTPMGDESIVNFNVPAFRFGSETYNRIGFTSNGYAVLGGGDANDVNFVPQTFPNATRPNNVLAPYWTDLHMGRTGAAFRVGTLTDGTNTWLVADWVGRIFTSNEIRTFQIWIQVGATEGIWYTYGTSGTGDPEGLNVGAENRDGSSGRNLGSIPANNSDLRVIADPPIPGGKVTIGYDAYGRNAGVFDVLAALTSNVTNTTGTEKVTITVTK